MANDDGYIKIKTKIEGLADSLKGIKDLGLGLFGMGSIYKTLTGTVKQLYAALDDLNKAYKAQKNAEVQLSTAVKNNPYLDSSSIRKLKEYASQLQSISTVGDEQLLPFMAQLAATGRSENEIMQIMSAALDASASGMISLDEAVRGLNNSFSGQIGRLGMQIPALKNLTKEELLAYCRKHIAKYAMPYDIEFKDDMPKTLVGKVAYRVLEEEELAKIKAADAASAEAE